METTNYFPLPGDTDPAHSEYQGSGKHADTPELELLSPAPRSTSNLRLKSNSSFPPLGVPAQKDHVTGLDLLTLGASIACCILAITAVANNNFAWRLGTTNQLILSGLALSIMNLCLAKSTPFLFLLLEARFGRSTLQNFDGILRNQVLSPRLDTVWQAALLFFLALSLGLSAAYKTFVGDSSSHSVHVTSLTEMPPDYGLFNVPGSIDADIARFNSASLPFWSATSLVEMGNGTLSEPVPPAPYPLCYGANILLIDDHSTSLLDMPKTSRLEKLQNTLAIGDVLRLQATVRGSVATQSGVSPFQDPEFESSCSDENMHISVAPMNHGSVFWFAPGALGDNSRMWFGFTPDYFSSELPSSKCNDIKQYGIRYDIRRRTCHGTWSITRASVKLMSGSCMHDDLPELQQLLLTKNSFFIGATLPVLTEMVRDFSGYVGIRNTSAWKNPSLTTAIASMVWSKTIGLQSPFIDDTPASNNRQSGWGGLNISLAENGILYDDPTEVAIKVRPTMRRSWVLYFIFMIQPILTAIFLAGAYSLYSVPLDRAFGVVSILAGINRNREQLDLFHGASLSGKLRNDVGLRFMAVRGEEASQDSSIRYEFVESSNIVHRGKLQPKIKYS